MEKGIDPLTGEEFYKKRSNQRFASRSNQIKFNNMKAHRKRKAKGKEDRILDNNRQVLKIILGSDQEVIKSLDYLQGAGLDFGYNTHSVKREDQIWICIYDYAYTRISPNTFKIIKLEP